MLKNDIRYVIKRVVVAVLIAMIIFFLKSNNVLALSWDMFPEDDVFIFNSSPKTVTININANSSSTQAVQRLNFDNSFTNSDNHDLVAFVYSASVEGVDPNLMQGSKAFVSTYFGAKLISNGSWSTCQFQDGLLVCPLKDGLTYTALQIYSTRPLDYSSIVVFNFTNSATYYTSVGQHTANLLETMTQQQQELINDQKDNSDVQTSDINVNQMENITGLLPAGPLDSLLALPLNLINILVAGTSGTCTPFTFTFVFNQEMSLPCFDTFWSQVPSSLMLFLSDVPAVYIFIRWAKSIYKRVERAVSFESSVDDEWGGV